MSTIVNAPSKYQIDVFDKFENTNKNIFISAVPGSGKTTTILQCMKLIPKIKPHAKSIFLAFNKNIKEELEKKVDEHIKVSTVHALGFGILNKHFHTKFKLNEIKNWIIGKNNLNIEHVDEDKRSAYLFQLSKLYDLYRMNLGSTIEEMQSIAFEYDLEMFDKEISDCWQMKTEVEKYNKGLGKHEIMIDFVDQLYLPVMFIPEEEWVKYDFVFFDEVQDANMLQYEIVKRIIKKRGRLIAVGDENQAIYGFMGSNIKVFNEIRNRDNTIELPLSYCYRCDTNIVLEANKIFPKIESPSFKKEGIVRSGSIQEIESGDIVICRNNAPLIYLYLYLLSKGEKSYILGKELGEQLLKIVSKIEDESNIKHSISDILDEYGKKLIEKGIKNPKTNKLYLKVEENCVIILMLHSRVGSVEKLKELIESIFIEKLNRSNAIMLSTIHKTKGMENDKVFILDIHLIPHKYAESQRELYQESCLKYVAITRPKTELIYINSSELTNL